MRKGLGVVMAVLALASIAATANASLVVRDTFTAAPPPSYPTPLVGHVPEVGGTWVAHSSTGLNAIQIINDSPPIPSPPQPGSAYLQQGLSSSEDANTLFLGGETAGTNSKYWAGFCVKVTGTDPVSGVYFAHFSDTGTAVFAARVGITDPSVIDFQFALWQSGSSIGATYPTAYLYNTWHRVVSSYAYTTGVTEMWVDPDPTKGPYDVGQVPFVSYAGSTAQKIKAYAFRQASITPTTGFSQQTLDYLAVGNNIADWPAVAGPYQIPEPATLALLMLGGLAVLRRR